MKDINSVNESQVMPLEKSLSRKFNEVKNNGAILTVVHSWDVTRGGVIYGILNGLAIVLNVYLRFNW